MSPIQQSLPIEDLEVDVRVKHRLNSPKRHGSSDKDAKPYLKELGISISEKKQQIQFTSNLSEHVHRWAPYVQGFSASFVQSMLDQYRTEYDNPLILDPFAGCGTVLVQAKLNGYKSIGTELNPLLHFIADTKLNCWDVSPNYLLKMYNSMPRNKHSPAPSFLKSHKHFNPGVLKNLETLRGGIEAIDTKNEKQRKAKDLIKLAFSSILIDCSNLKRSPCLGYCKNKKVYDTAPFVLLNQKIHNIVDDLRLIHSQYNAFINTESQIILANAMGF
jgi:tellurite resistance-related uncharacterized protein